MSEIREIPKGWGKAIFEDLLDYIQPTKFIVESTEYDDKYKTPVLTAGKSFIIGHTNETNGIFNEIPVIIFDDFTTSTQFVNFQFKVKSSAMKILKPTCELLSIKYVFYFMQIIHISVDTHKRYWISHYSQLPIPLPPLPEQHRIVAKIEELFSSLDKGIESLKTAQQQLKVYRQSVLKWAFEGKLTNKKVVEGELPQGWKYLKLRDITTEKDGLRRGPFGSAIKKEFFVPSGYKVYEQGNAINDDPYRGNYFIDEKKYMELVNFKVIPGDLIVSCSGVTLGRISEIPNDAKPGIINQALLRIRLKYNLIRNKYFILYFRGAFFQKKIFDQSQGTAMPNLVGIKDFKEIELLIPPLPEQHAIVGEIESRLSVCDKIEESIEHSLKQSEALRQSILKKAFEGKLVPQDPNDEPASVLLDRIQAEREKNKSENPPRRQAGKQELKRQNHEQRNQQYIRHHQ